MRPDRPPRHRPAPLTATALAGTVDPAGATLQEARPAIASGPAAPACGRP
ncbi:MULTISPECIES: hypothetical protein [Streptomyces]|nr:MULTISPECIES: hypothetical protein [Streptomyces]MBK3520616.1 hypothetical protein [Streptomyces sp. MBT70]GGR72667.1 hypothetical protein GCM10010236_28980 [Streptomyces eurythermus]